MADLEGVRKRVEQALEQSRQAPAQQYVEIMRGLSIKRTQRGLPVTRIHYSADPERDPELNPRWKESERATYSSQAAWDREQEIVDEAGGGELVLADVLVSHWKKIVITDPKWRPDPRWDVDAGFDHGKTNPTALEKVYKDFTGSLYLCGEYYMPGLEIWEHAKHLKKLADIRKIQHCPADPSIFPQVNQQSGANKKDSAKSYNDLYIEQGIELFTSFVGDRSDVSYAARLMQHWADLGPSDRELEGISEKERAEELAKHRKPTLYIVCRNFSDRPQPGLHNWDCPNLLWEFMRIRRRKLTAQQLLSRNLSEEIIDKDNHGWDASKYCIMSLPEPTQKTKEQILQERLAHIPQEDVTSRMIRGEEILHELEDDEIEMEEGIPMGRPRPGARRGRV